MLTIEDFNKEFNLYTEKKKILIQPLINLFSKLLSESDLINNITWNQYTPYFNDGEECEFRIDTDCILINGEDIDNVDYLEKHNYIKLLTQKDIDENNKIIDTTYTNLSKNHKIGDKGYCYNPNFNKKEFDIIEKIKSFLYNIDSKILLEIFGDHVSITVYKNGESTIEKYEHE